MWLVRRPTSYLIAFIDIIKRKLGLFEKIFVSLIKLSVKMSQRGMRRRHEVLKLKHTGDFGIA